MADEPHEVRLHLLDGEGDRPQNLTATADPATDTYTVTWDPVADAEWYTVKIRSKYNFPGPYQWDFAVVDTTVALRPIPIGHAQILDANIYVAAGCGARPDATGRAFNLAGTYLAGNIYSVTDDVHFYLPVTPTAPIAPGDEEAVTVPTLRELWGEMDPGPARWR